MREDDQVTQRDDAEHYDGPAGGWGSLSSISKVIAEERPEIGVLQTLMR